MKFACERCGKRFASVDEPAAGRVYRIRCRCGHVIVVRGPASASTRHEAGVDLSRFEPPPLPPPLAAADVEEPSRLQRPSPAARDVGAAGGEPSADVAPARPAPAEEPAPLIEDDPFLRAAASSVSEPARPAERWDEERSAAIGDGASGRGDPLAAEQGGVAAVHVALPAPLSLGLDEDGAGGVRRPALLAAVVAVLAFVAALAMWRM